MKRRLSRMVARAERGKATEVFVRRGNRWLNTGWQLAPETSAAGARGPVPPRH